jgi:hypothetical protein
MQKIALAGCTLGTAQYVPCWRPDSLFVWENAERLIVSRMQRLRIDGFGLRLTFFLTSLLFSQKMEVFSAGISTL